MLRILVFLSGGPNMKWITIIFSMLLWTQGYRGQSRKCTLLPSKHPYWIFLDYGTFLDLPKLEREECCWCCELSAKSTLPKVEGVVLPDETLGSLLQYRPWWSNHLCRSIVKKSHFLSLIKLKDMNDLIVLLFFKIYIILNW